MGADAVLQALVLRHPEPDCQALAQDPTALPTLRRVAAEVEQPPWAALRATRCLTLSFSKEAAEDLRRWVADPGQLGLARVILRELPQLPEPEAVPLAQAALTGPHRAEAQDALTRDPRPALQALLASRPASP